MTLFFLVLVLFVLFNTPLTAADASGLPQSSVTNGTMNMSIDLCCRWDEQISDGVLKYRLVDMPEKQREEVTEAFATWNSQLHPSLKLVEVGSIHEKAEVTVAVGELRFGDADQFVKDVEAGETAGQSINNLDNDGHITSATIILSDEIFDKRADLDTLFTVILHEIGHVLGLGHANFDDLMNPMVGSGQVSACDANGVVEINELVLTKGITPSPSHISLDEENTMIC